MPRVRLLAVTGERKFMVCSLLEGAMADPSSRRKMAAILSADVVGYSRLMGANEAATVETLKSYRDIIARLVARHGGRIALRVRERLGPILVLFQPNFYQQK